MPTSPLDATKSTDSINAPTLARNALNARELAQKIEILADDRLRGIDPERAQKTRAWLTSVARKHFLREGAAVDVSPHERDLPDWAAPALAQGQTVIRVLFTEEEQERTRRVVDWLRAARGPSLKSDWSRMSFAQAEAAERAWVESNARAAQKRLAEEADAGADAEGTRTELELAGGWRWVSVFGAKALDREGALMRHCADSYAEVVGEGMAQIYSLRDPNNQPQLTIEASGVRLAQLKAFANGVMKPEHAERAGAFLRAFDAKMKAEGKGPARFEGLDWAAAHFFRAGGETAEIRHASELSAKEIHGVLLALKGDAAEQAVWGLAPWTPQARAQREADIIAAETRLLDHSEAASSFSQDPASFDIPKDSLSHADAGAFLRAVAFALGRDGTPASDDDAKSVAAAPDNEGRARAMLGAWLPGAAPDLNEWEEWEGVDVERAQLEAAWIEGALAGGRSGAVEKEIKSLPERWAERPAVAFAALGLAFKTTLATHSPMARDFYDASLSAMARVPDSDPLRKSRDASRVCPIANAIQKGKSDWAMQSAQEGMAYFSTRALLEAMNKRAPIELAEKLCENAMAKPNAPTGFQMGSWEYTELTDMIDESLTAENKNSGALKYLTPIFPMLGRAFWTQAKNRLPPLIQRAREEDLSVLAAIGKYAPGSVAASVAAGLRPTGPETVARWRAARSDPKEFGAESPVAADKAQGVEPKTPGALSS